MPPGVYFRAFSKCEPAARRSCLLTPSHLIGFRDSVAGGYMLGAKVSHWGAISGILLAAFDNIVCNTCRYMTLH